MKFESYIIEVEFISLIVECTLKYSVQLLIASNFIFIRRLSRFRRNKAQIIVHVIQNFRKNSC